MNTPHRCRPRWRRAALAAAIGVLLLAAAGYFPLPVGWAVRAAVQRAIPPGVPWTLAIPRATFEWRWGSPRLRLRIGGLEWRDPSRGRLSVAAVSLDFEKHALLSGYFAPARIEADGVRVALDVRPATQPAVAPAASARVPAPATGGAVPLDGAMAWLLPEGEAVRMAVRDLQAGLATPDGRFDPGAIGIMALVRHGPGRLELAGELSGGGSGSGRARIRFGATLPFREPTVAVRLQAPAFDLHTLPAWPGIGALPVAGRGELEARIDLDLRSAARFRGQCRVGLTAAAWEHAAFAQPLPLHADLQMIVAGEPLRVSLSASRLDAAGASLEIRAAAAELGAEPRFEWDVSGAVHGAELRRWVAAPPQAPWLPWLEMADVNWNSAGVAGVVRDGEGAWSLQHASVRGDVGVSGPGDPCRIRGTAEMSPGDERVRARIEVDAMTPGTWFQRSGADPRAALQVPVGAQLAAEWTPRGTLVSAGGRLTLGAGEIRWPGLPGRAVPVRDGEVRATFDAAAGVLRIASARVEFAGPVASAREVELRFDSQDVLRIAGEAQVENLSGRWIAPRLSRDQRAALRLLGRLRWGELTLDRCRLAGEWGIALRPAGGATLHSTAASVELAARVKAAPVTIAGGITLHGGSEELHLAFDLRDLRIAPWGLTLSDALPPGSAWDFPLDLGVRARASLARGIEEAAVSVRAGPGVLRGWKAYGRDLPLRSFTLEARASDRFQRLAVSRFEAEIGDGVRLGGRELSWETATPSRLAGELELLPCSAAALGALLPESLAALAGPWLRTGNIDGVHLRGRARADPTTAGGWHWEEASVRAAASDLRGEVAGLGAVKVGRAEVEARHPQATVRFLQIAAPAVHAGDVDVLVNVDTRDFAAPRASGIVDAGRLRLTGGILADIRPLGAPVAFALERCGDELSFDVQAPDVLGLPLQMREGRMLPGGTTEPFRLRLPHVEWGRTRLSAGLRSGGGRTAVEVTGRYVDAEELVGALGPLARRRPESAPAEAGPAPTAMPADAGGTRFEFSARLDEVRFSDARHVREVELAGWRDARGLAEFRLRACEGSANGLTASLRPDGGGRLVTLQAADASAWIDTLTAPLARAAVGAPLDAAIPQVRQIPQLLGGGAIDVTGQLLDETSFAGRVQVENVRVLRPPRVLQLLSLKAGRSWETQPLIQRLAVERLTLGPSAVELQTLLLTGSGLVSRLKVDAGRYQLDSERLAIEGDYFGVGFEITGTRAEPQVFLKDSSLLVRTLGQRNEFDFEAMAREQKARGR